LKLCCKNEIHTNPAFGCKNTLDCPVDPKPNADFEGLFWLHFILFVMQCVWLGVYLYFLIDKKKDEKEEEVQEAEEVEQKEVEEGEEDIKKVEFKLENNNFTKKIHGLKKRK
jgi:hypothetical protein